MHVDTTSVCPPLQCEVADPGLTMSGWTKAGYINAQEGKNAYYMAYNGHVQYHTYDFTRGKVTYAPVYVRFPDKHECGSLPLNNHYFYIDSIYQHFLNDVHNLNVKSRVNGKWYRLSSYLESGPHVGNLTDPQRGYMMNEPWVIMEDGVAKSSSSIIAQYQQWGGERCTVFATTPDGRAYHSGRRPPNGRLEWGSPGNVYDIDCKRYRYSSSSSMGSLDWYLSTSTPYVVSADVERELQKNPVPRKLADGSIVPLTHVKEFAGKYFNEALTESGDVLLASQFADGGSNYGIHVNSAFGDGYAVDSGFSKEWYGPFYEYPHQWMHNGKVYGSSGIAGQFVPLYRYKPAADGSMHDPNVRIESSHPSVSVFDDAHTILDGAWGTSYISRDGYVYPRIFSMNGNMASHYTHRFDPSRGPLVIAPRVDAFSETGIGYVPPGDYLRPMVKKSAVDGTLKYVKLTGTPTQIKDNVHYQYGRGNFIFFDDDGYLYITGLGTGWQNDELKHLVETAYPNEFTSVIADDGVPDSESFAARVDFPPSIYDTVRSDPLYSLYSLGNDDTRLATVTEADSSSIPIAVDLGEYVVSEVYKTHHKWIGPNYALPVKVKIEGQGDYVHIQKKDYWLLSDVKNSCAGCDQPGQGVMLYKKDGTAWNWQWTESLNLHQVSVNGQGPQTPLIPRKAKPSINTRHVITALINGNVASTKVTCRDFPTPCAVDHSVPFTPSAPVPFEDFCKRDGNNHTPCVYTVYNNEERADRSMSCYGALHEDPFRSYTVLREQQICENRDREDQKVSYTNHNLNSSNYDTATYPEGSVMSFAYACQKTCAKYNNPYITFRNVTTMTLDMTGATSFTVKGSHVPILRKLVLENTQHLTSLTLDGVKLTSLTVPMTASLTISTNSASAVSHLKLTGTGSVSVSVLNHLDGANGAFFNQHVQGLPSNHPLVKGAVRLLDFGDDISISGNLGDLAMPQLWKLRARGVTQLNLPKMLQGCPKLTHLDVDVSPATLDFSSIGPIGALFKESGSFINNDNVYPNRQLTLAPLGGDLDLVRTSLSGAHVRYLRIDDAASGNVGALSQFGAHLHSLRIKGSISGHLNAASFTNLETLSLHSTGSLTLDMEESFGSQACSTLKTLEFIQGSDSSSWTGSLSSLHCYKLSVLHLSHAQVSGSLTSLDVSNMNSLILSHTSVTGSLSHLSSAAHLYHLDVSDTAIAGATSNLSGLANLNYLGKNSHISTDSEMTNACGTISVMT